MGFAISSVAVPHVVDGEPWTGLAIAGTGGAFLFVGLAVLAWID